MTQWQSIGLILNIRKKQNENQKSLILIFHLEIQSLKNSFY